MLSDLILAILHHLAVVILIVLIAVELGLLKPGLSVRDLRILAIVDAAYGATAGLVIIIGVCRVIWGIKGVDFYLSNPWFWSKMASFALIGILSVPPTIAILKWRKVGRADATFLPPDTEVSRLRVFVKTQVALLALVVAFAAAMARYGAF
jgi:putative membrane protein